MILKTYEFFLVLPVAEVTDVECDALYEAGCDDGTVVSRNEMTYIAFDREADSLKAAIRSAAADVKTAGFEVVRVEMDALV